jgi:uncharacterized protein YdaU (DUF1376 family)
MNFYKRHIGDYIKKAGHLTLLEHGIYARLMDVYYTREAGIPEDKAARLIGARTKEEVQALSNVLDEFFTLVDGVWTQGRCEEEIGIASAKADKNRENGAKGGRPRKSASESKPNGNPNGFDFENHVGSEKNLSQTPDSRLQTKNLNADDDTTDGGYASPSSAPLPEREDPPGSDNPAIVMAVALRKLGVDATFTHPAVQDWTTRQIAPEVLDAAVSLAREQKGPTARIPANYLVPIVEKLLNPPPMAEVKPQQQRDSWEWKRTPGGIEAKGRELGMFARGTENHADFAKRIEAEIEKRKGRAA